MQQRRRYAADRARRRYERVEPEKRLVADARARLGEAALHAAEAPYPRLQLAHPVVPWSLPRRRRMAGTALGTSLPTVWQPDTWSRAQRKALRRGLIAHVVLHRVPRETIQTRSVGRRGAISALEVPSTVGSLREMRGVAKREVQILALETHGNSDAALAQRLPTPGVRSPQRPRVRPRAVPTIRLQQGRLHRDRGPRPRQVPGWLPVSHLATALGITAHGVYHLIRQGRIRVTRDSAPQLYRLPNRPEPRAVFRRLQQGHISHVPY